MFNKYNLKYYSKIFGVFIFLLISSFILISCSDNDLKNLTSRSQGFINSWQNGNEVPGARGFRVFFSQFAYLYGVFAGAECC